MEDNKYIQVSEKRFHQIFRDSNYISEIRKDFHEFSSCPYYNVIDSKTNEVVGIYSDGSWENTFKVILDLVSKQDVINHYEKELEYLKSDLKRTEEAYKKLREYKNLTPEQRAEADKKELEEIEFRKTHPGLFEFLEPNSIIAYSFENCNVDEFFEAIKK